MKKYVKTIIILFAVMLSALALSSCDSLSITDLCDHKWVDATCTAPKTCSTCAETEGEALGHTWIDAACTAPKTCSTCAETEGEALGHVWIDATCTAPKTCSTCAETEGEALGHTWIDATCIAPKTCSTCAETEGEALGHTWIDATCTAPKTCSTCAETEGEPQDHIWLDATCTMPKTCSVCAETEGQALGHAWVAATCTTPETCSACAETKGKALGHTWVAATCTTPKICSICAETGGEALGHNYVNGKCSVCEQIDEVYCLTTYEAMCEEMLDMTKDDSLSSIKEKLDSLPTEYKDVANLREEYTYIKAQYQVLSTAVVNDFLKYVLPEEAEKYYIDYAQVRRAYLNLINNAENYPKWDLIGLANDELMGKNDAGNSRSWMFFVLVGNWSTSDGEYWFDIVENEDNSLSFRTNLPNNKVYSKSYYYNIEGRIIGYEEIGDESNSFNAFRVSEIGDDYIKVYCFKNSQTYTLYKE
ncbi:MAG: hypothetical protein IJC64_05000 [Clostridia bacterium]|nr:hypothetical protein [Clostridia bacterium]